MNEEKQNKILSALKKALKERRRLLAGMLAGISATVALGTTALKSDKDKGVSKIPKDSIEEYDNNYNKQSQDNKESIQSPVGIEKFVTLAPTPMSSELKMLEPIAIQKSTMEVTTVKYGSQTLSEGSNVSLYTKNDDETFDKPLVSYSTTKLTNGDVEVTIIANKEVQKIEGWNLSEDKKILTKTYIENANETVIVKDLAENEEEVFIIINNIDKTFKKAKVFYSTTELTSGNVEVTIKADEELQNIKGWTLSEDKKSLTKTYTSNKIETVPIKDLAGNIQQVQIEVNNIIREYNNNYNSEIEGPSNPDPTPSESEPIEPEQPTPTEPTKIKIEDLLSIDQDSLIFDYNGKPYLPGVDTSKLPDGVELNFIYDDGNGKGTDAGEHTLRIEIKEKDGYTAEPVEISYEVTPVKVSCSYEYNKETGELNAVYENIKSEDIANTSYTVNGEELTTDTVEPGDYEYGLYKVESSIEIKPEKLKNYDLNDLTESTMYEVKRENTWYDIETEWQETDGKIVLDVYLAGNKLPGLEYEDEETEEKGIIYLPALAFNVYFDESKIKPKEKNEEIEIDEGYVEAPDEEISEDGMLTNADGWSGDINTAFEHPTDGPMDEDLHRDFSTISDGYDSIDGYETMPGKVKVCSFTFEYQEGHENDKDIVIRLDDIVLSIASDYWFTYTTNASVCTGNPKDKEQVKPIEIKKGNYLQDDAFYEGHVEVPDEDDLEEEKSARAELQDYIDNVFKIPDHSDEEEFEVSDELTIDDENAEEQTYTEVDYEGQVPVTESMTPETFKNETEEYVYSEGGLGGSAPEEVSIKQEGVLTLTLTKKN